MKTTTFIYRSLNGEETSVELGRHETANFETPGDHAPFLRIERRKGAWVIQQLAPVLTLDHATKAWVAEQMANWTAKQRRKQ